MPVKTIFKMRISALSSCVVLAILTLLPLQVLAAVNYQWNIPNQMRIVQAAPVDNIRTFPTIQTAIASIPSDGNRYQIKVMPGTYSGAFTMPSNADLVGSGQESTIIQSNIIIPADASVTFRNLAIQLTDSSSQDAITCLSGSSFQFIDSKLTCNGTNGHTHMGIYSSGNSLLIKNSTIDMRATNGYIYALPHDCNDVKVINSDINLDAGQVDVFNVGGGSTKIFNSTISVKGNTAHTYLTSGGGYYEIHDSTISVTNPDTDQSRTGVISTNGNVKVYNSTLATTGTAIVADTIEVNNSTVSGQTFGLLRGSSFKIGNSQLVGGHNGVPGDKITNCVDGNFDPIASIPNP